MAYSGYWHGPMRLSASDAGPAKGRPFNDPHGSRELFDLADVRALEAGLCQPWVIARDDAPPSSPPAHTVTIGHSGCAPAFLDERARLRLFADRQIADHSTSFHDESGDPRKLRTRRAPRAGPRDWGITIRRAVMVRW